MLKKPVYTLLGLLGLISVSLPAQAELGDYSFWQTLGNLFSPRTADHPVTDAERQAQQYPLTPNPEWVDDGFRPGAYLEWQTVEMHPSTGALCGNGSPYKFFVNRVAHTSNTVVYMEGGGACWDYESCTGQTGIRGARNPDGIPDDYMSLMNPSATLVSPFVFRLHPWTATKSQEWNMVYLPYCTGDIYAGDRVALYEDPSGEGDPLVWYHNGIKNLRAATAWLRDNLQRSGQMLVTGCSAGGAGSIANYHPLRRDLAPQRSYLINDSGPIFPAPVNGSDTDYPSLRLHNTIRNVWGLDDGPLGYLQSELAYFDLNDIGTLYAALAEQYPNDRLGQTHFWEDMNYSSYSYERFYEDIYDEADPALREARIHERWYQDTEQLKSRLAAYDNFGYYLPRFRDVNESHCTTIIEFNNSDIQQAGLELKDFVENVMEGQGAVMQASETDTVSDYQKGFNLLYWLLDQAL
ncbi:pectin acetylesterase-family hydrolase [Reinekea sp. G2M2-21]|uniref:pectin acetylesterase-family hydrolase n=1 Tax=Reinekea sp. G2M2-21 TaxID=2788942 RepID=UPI0018AC724E|nr:pectin acetylesterase-family hydrolase [Reinekea sp. G2M2-21]